MQSVNGCTRQLALYYKPLCMPIPHKKMASARDMIDDALVTMMHAMQTTVATTHGSVPGSLAFARDMFLNVLLIADWQSIARLHEHHVNENLH